MEKGRFRDGNWKDSPHMETFFNNVQKKENLPTWNIT